MSRSPQGAGLTSSILSSELPSRLETKFTQQTAADSIQFGLPAGDTRTRLILGAKIDQDKQASALEFVNGYGVADEENPTRNTSFMFEPGEEHEIVVEVRTTDACTGVS